MYLFIFLCIFVVIVNIVNINGAVVKFNVVAGDDGSTNYDGDGVLARIENGKDLVTTFDIQLKHGDNERFMEFRHSGIYNIIIEVHREFHPKPQKPYASDEEIEYFNRPNDDNEVRTSIELRANKNVVIENWFHESAAKYNGIWYRHTRYNDDANKLNVTWLGYPFYTNNALHVSHYDRNWHKYRGGREIRLTGIMKITRIAPIKVVKVY